MRAFTTPVQFTIPFALDEMPMRIASIGSCFSEKIVELLNHAGFACASNPNGIVYNPVSMERSVLHISENQPYTEKDFFFFNGKYHSMEHHGSFSRETLSEAILAAEKSRNAFSEFPIITGKRVAMGLSLAAGDSISRPRISQK